MINTYHKRQKSKGFSTLLMTLVVLLSVTLLAFLTASSVITHQRVVTVEHHIQQSFHAAQAGLNYGIIYLDKNYSSVVDNQTITGTLGDGSNYSVKFIFKAGKDTIQIESTGMSSDGQVQSDSKEWVKYKGGLSVNAPPQPLTVRGSVDLNGNSRIENSETSINILAGGAVDINGAAATFLAGGILSSNMFITNSDIEPGDVSLSAMTNEELATVYLGQSIIDIQSAAGTTYTNSSNYDYSAELNGVTGGTIFINQLAGEARIHGDNVTVGTPSSPVTILVEGNMQLQGASAASNITINGNVIVTGDLELHGNVTVNGLVMVLGTDGLDMSGNALVNGAIVSGGDATTELSFAGSSKVQYNSSVLDDALSGLPGVGGGYSRIAGSWIDNKVTP